MINEEAKQTRDTDIGSHKGEFENLAKEVGPSLVAHMQPGFAV